MFNIYKIQSIFTKLLKNCVYFYKISCFEIKIYLADKWHSALAYHAWAVMYYYFQRNCYFLELLFDKYPFLQFSRDDWGFYIVYYYSTTFIFLLFSKFNTLIYFLENYRFFVWFTFFNFMFTLYLTYV